MAKQLELDHTFLEMAYVFANLSKAKRRKVGCIIVKDGQVISNGLMVHLLVLITDVKLMM